MKLALATLVALTSIPAFAAPKHCPLSIAVNAAQDEFAKGTFGEPGAEKTASFAGITSTGKEQFFVTIDGTDGGNGITDYVVYLKPGSCQLANAPKAIREE